MATKAEGSEPLQGKSWVLRVSIHCEGCKKKVRRILKQVPGVITTEIDSQQNKVTVTGNVEADTLIRKLEKSGKHADLWRMEKKPNNPNPNPSGTEKGKDVDKEKDASKSNEPNLKPERAPEKSAATATSSETDSKPAETASKEQAPAVTKPAESDTKPAESSNKEVSKPDPKPDKATAASSEAETETETKPADTATKSGNSDEKKSKNKGAEAAGNEEVFVMNSGGAPPMHQQPAYPQPVYAASYNMVHPTASYSYYAPMPPQPQSSMYSGHLLPPQGNHQPATEYYPHYPRENYYSHESYYETAPSSAQSQGSYDYFSDENTNSCNVM